MCRELGHRLQFTRTESAAISCQRQPRRGTVKSLWTGWTATPKRVTGIFLLGLSTLFGGTRLVGLMLAPVGSRTAATVEGRSRSTSQPRPPPARAGIQRDGGRRGGGGDGSADETRDAAEDGARSPPDAVDEAPAPRADAGGGGGVGAPHGSHEMHQRSADEMRDTAEEGSWPSPNNIDVASAPQADAPVVGPPRLPFCDFDNRTGHRHLECPPPVSAHKPSCRGDVLATAGADAGLPPLARPGADLVPRLLDFFHGRRVAVLGDSLARQWFETLACRLGRNVTWYPRRQRAPPALRAAEDGYGASFPPLHDTPRGYGRDGVCGYGSSHASVVDDGPLCRTLNTTLDYFHVDVFDNETHARRIFDFVAASYDAFVFNIGAHYRKNLVLYNTHAREIMQLCGAFNAETKARSGRRRCYFRETLPGHFHRQSTCGEYATREDPWLCGEHDYTSRRQDNTATKAGKKTNARKEKRKKRKAEKHMDPNMRCGPVQTNLTSTFNVIARHHAVSYGVPLVNASALKDAWRWHPNNDCRHFCQDNEVWDLLHESLFDAADAYDPVNALEKDS